MTRLGERAGLVGLAAFVAVDVLLVGIAVNSTRKPVADGGQQIGSSTVGTSSGGASNRPTTPATTTTAGSTDASQPDVKVAPLTVGIVGIAEPVHRPSAAPQTASARGAVFHRIISGPSH